MRTGEFSHLNHIRTMKTTEVVKQAANKAIHRNLQFYFERINNKTGENVSFYFTNNLFKKREKNV